MRRWLARALALALGAYLALRMGTVALDLRQETQRHTDLLRTTQTVERRIADLTAPEDPAAAVTRAFRQYGLVAPEDVVFFDEGNGG